MTGKISDLTPLTGPLAGTDLFEVVRAGVNYKALGSDIPSGGGGGGSGNLLIGANITTSSSGVTKLGDTYKITNYDTRIKLNDIDTQGFLRGGVYYAQLQLLSPTGSSANVKVNIDLYNSLDAFLGTCDIATATVDCSISAGYTSPPASPESALFGGIFNIPDFDLTGCYLRLRFRNNYSGVPCSLLSIIYCGDGLLGEVSV